jgi:putative ABC transport system permease protein
MLRRAVEIITSSFVMALQELWNNKLRTFLSLFGITIGIFCIIGVLATVQSLEHNIQNEIKSLGTNTIYIDKWDYGAGNGGEYPYWKYVNRPSPEYNKVALIKQQTPAAQYVAFRIKRVMELGNAEHVISNVNVNGVNGEFHQIQPIDIAIGRYISVAEFEVGRPVAIVGYGVAEKLFGNINVAIGKIITCKGKNVQVIGIIKKQGKQLIGGWDFDQSMITPYVFAKTIMNERKADPIIMVQGKTTISSIVLKDELAGSMRAINRLSPGAEDNFSLNDINDFSTVISNIFSGVNLGGWAIAALSLIVGMFGVANIMFVTVRERTTQIGLKKAIGAKKRTIMAEFLLESAFLCIVGGIMGLLLVLGLAQILTYALKFPVFVSVQYMTLAIIICIITGVLAGFIPALQASRLNPVEAIRST